MPEHDNELGHAEQLKTDIQKKLAGMDPQQLSALKTTVEKLSTDPNFLLELQQFLDEQIETTKPISEPVAPPPPTFDKSDVKKDSADEALEELISEKHVVYPPEKMATELKELLKSELEPLVQELDNAIDCLHTAGREDLVEALYLEKNETDSIPTGIKGLIEQLSQLQSGDDVWKKAIRGAFSERWLHHSFRDEAVCRDYLADIEKVKPIYQALIKINRAILRALHRLDIKVLGVAGDDTAPTIRMLTVRPELKSARGMMNATNLLKVPQMFDRLLPLSNERLEKGKLVDIKMFGTLTSTGEETPTETYSFIPSNWSEIELNMVLHGLAKRKK